MVALSPLSSPGSPLVEEVEVGIKLDFIEKYRDDAILVGLACDFPPIILLVQAALETGWGRHMISNNLYGIKDVPWLPGSEAASTTEYDGVWKTFQFLIGSLEASSVAFSSFSWKSVSIPHR